MHVHLIAETTSGCVQGFADTFPLRDTSSAVEVEKGIDGGQKAVWKWLVSGVSTRALSNGLTSAAGLKGIPYARAGRWERPAAPKPWKEVLKAWEFGSKFPQPDNAAQLFRRVPGALKRDWVQQSETTSHTVNVYAPEGTKPGDDLPVMVWIYGGSLVSGADSLFIYDGTEWIRRSSLEGKKFILVTANYRTNIFGFFSGPELLASDPDGLCGNYGLYDCIFMLRWVQNNITSFGGSPSRVTLFGQSAGAVIVSHLLVSGQKLFRRAIIMSGAPDTLPQRPPSSSYAAYSALLSSLPSSLTPAQKIDHLRSLPWEELLALDGEYATRFWLGTGITLEPHENEKSIWTDKTMKRLERGEWDSWIGEVMVGSMGDEGTIYADRFELFDKEKLERYISKLPLSVQPAVRNKYLHANSNSASSPPTSPTQPPDLISLPGSHLIADQLFNFPIWKLATALSSRSTKMKVWMYKYEETIEKVAAFGGKNYGAMHGGDSPLVFNTNVFWSSDHVDLDAPSSSRIATSNSDLKKASKSIGDRFFAFAESGNPDEEWIPFTVDSPRCAVFEKGGGRLRNQSLKGYGEGVIDFGVGED